MAQFDNWGNLDDRPLDHLLSRNRERADQGPFCIMGTIQLTRGYVAIVDDADLPFLSERKWSSLITKSGKVYAINFLGATKSTATLMHRFLLDAPQGKTVDHANGNTLDNRRSNLRLASYSKNIANQVRGKSNDSSRFKGVHWCSMRWRAQIRRNGKRVHLGYFTEEVEAGKAYNRAALLIYGQFANLNEIPCR